MMMSMGLLVSTANGRWFDYISDFVQEPGAGNVITYARSMEGIVRKKDDRRRAAREAKAARKAAEAAALEEEVKRRKAAKRRELDSRCDSSRCNSLRRRRCPKFAQAVHGVPAGPSLCKRRPLSFCPMPGRRRRLRV